MSKQKYSGSHSGCGFFFAIWTPKTTSGVGRAPTDYSCCGYCLGCGVIPHNRCAGRFCRRDYTPISIPSCTNSKNYCWSDGISSSIRTGISALPDAVDAAIFIPADQPLLTPSFLQNLVSHYEATERAIVVPHSADGEPGNPVLFDRRFFSELSQLSGDTGGKRLLSKYAGDIAKLPITNATILMDVDSPEALDRLWTYKTSQPALDLVKTQGIICDMDGVLWRGDESLEGLHDFLRIYPQAEFRLHSCNE